jgi:hypothetical protein
MGYIRHHGFLVTSWDRTAISRAHAVALACFAPEMIDQFHNRNARLVSPVTEGIVNRTFSFAVFPDGSKEGWPESERADTQRTRFTEWLRGELHAAMSDAPDAAEPHWARTRLEDGSTSLSWVEVQYGDDEHETRVVTSSDDETLRFRAAHPNWADDEGDLDPDERGAPERCAMCGTVLLPTHPHAVCPECMKRPDLPASVTDLIHPF